MAKTLTLALDAMGGDHGVSVTVPAALQALRGHADLHLILVGDQARIEAELSQLGAAVSPRLRLQHASQVVDMAEPPLQALRHKRDSSMRVAICLVRDGQADACVSAGNTGALVAVARNVLKTLPGIDRPAIISTIPGLGHNTHMLDLGANVDVEAQHLLQFAVMGAVMVEAVTKTARPRIGLLSNGVEEDIKGTAAVRRAAALFKATPGLNYVGFVEADGIYRNQADVVVCDGFVGNVALKSAEGVASLIGKIMREEFERGVGSKLAGLLSKPTLDRVRGRIDPRRYNGASLLGLRGIVVKSHGGADAYAFGQAIAVAVIEAREQLPELIHRRLAEMPSESPES
jgi:phosphate acyltransferase